MRGAMSKLEGLTRLRFWACDAQISEQGIGGNWCGRHLGPGYATAN